MPFFSFHFIPTGCSKLALNVTNEAEGRMWQCKGEGTREKKRREEKRREEKRREEKRREEKRGSET